MYDTGVLWIIERNGSGRCIGFALVLSLCVCAYVCMYVCNVV